MKRNTWFWLVIVTLFGLLVPVATTQADITAVGDVAPNVTTWNSSTTSYVGNTANGSLTVDGGDGLASDVSHIGKESTAAGHVSIVGPNSSWQANQVFIGHSGTGSLNIMAGGSATVSLRSYIGGSYLQTGGVGEVTVRGLGSLWECDYAEIGSMGNGTLLIADGGKVTNYSASIGSRPSSIGQATVRGLGSDWQARELTVGFTGDGTLEILNGGSVSTTWDFHIGYEPSSNGNVTVRGANSTLTVGQRLYLGGSVPGFSLVADGTEHNVMRIIEGGTVNSKSGSIGDGPRFTGEVIVSGPGSAWNNSEELSVGFQGDGELTITQSGTVTSSRGFIGYKPDIESSFTPSSGMVFVRGAGSKWSNSSAVYVGYMCNGKLAVTDGGAVESGDGFVGYEGEYPSFRADGHVMVSGIGSRWDSSGNLVVGHVDSGILNLAAGGAVTTQSVAINNKSRLAVEVTHGSQLNIEDGAGTLTNNGTIRILAGAGATAGEVCLPIQAGTWTGAGSYEALGGTWNGASREFTVSDVALGDSGDTVSVDLASTQRVRFGQTGGTQQAGISFRPGGAVDVTAAVVDGAMAAELETLLEEGDELQSAWQFAVSGSYASGNPAYVSLGIGPGFTHDMTVWRHDGAGWAEFDAKDLAYDGIFASFTVDGFSAFAVSGAPVPEPSTVVLLLGLALFGLACRKRCWA
ncbi:MAG: PEP-CTERM sorting domain-containing protein [Pirellulales bacterium]|nr:PEP-CTERM sorting domain-containing protein [Pirellulales bacterium]